MSYGKIHDSFWSDEKIYGLPDDAKLLAAYLITGPHRSIVGAMRLPLGYISADLNWNNQRARDALAALIAIGFIVRDDETCWTHVRNQLLYDPPKNPNQVKAAYNAAFVITSPMILASVRERSLTHLRHHNISHGRLFEQLPNPSPTVQQRLPEPLPNPSPTVPKPFRNSDSDSESESNTESDSESGTDTRTGATPPRARAPLTLVESGKEKK